MEDVLPVVADKAQEVVGTVAQAWQLTQADFSQLMTLGTSVLIALIGICALLAVAVGCLLGVVLTMHWRP